MTKVGPPDLELDFQIAAEGALPQKRKKKRKHANAPLSLRLSFEEKARLQEAAAGMSLAAYVRWRVFDPSNPPPRHRGKQPVKDHRALAQVLAMLGQSRLSNNLNQLARAANSGCLDVTPDTEAAIATAAADIAEIRRLLIEALRLEAS